MLGQAAAGAAEQADQQQQQQQGTRCVHEEEEGEEQLKPRAGDGAAAGSSSSTCAATPAGPLESCSPGLAGAEPPARVRAPQGPPACSLAPSVGGDPGVGETQAHAQAEPNGTRAAAADLACRPRPRMASVVHVAPPGTAADRRVRPGAATASLRAWDRSMRAYVEAATLAEQAASSIAGQASSSGSGGGGTRQVAQQGELPAAASAALDSACGPATVVATDAPAAFAMGPMMAMLADALASGATAAPEPPQQQLPLLPPSTSAPVPEPPCAEVQASGTQQPLPRPPGVNATPPAAVRAPAEQLSTAAAAVPPDAGDEQGAMDCCDAGGSPPPLPACDGKVEGEVLAVLGAACPVGGCSTVREADMDVGNGGEEVAAWVEDEAASQREERPHQQEQEQEEPGAGASFLSEAAAEPQAAASAAEGAAGAAAPARDGAEEDGLLHDHDVEPLGEGEGDDGLGDALG